MRAVQKGGGVEHVELKNTKNTKNNYLEQVFAYICEIFSNTNVL